LKTYIAFSLEIRIHRHGLFFFDPFRPRVAVIINRHCYLLWPLRVLVHLAPLVLRHVGCHLISGVMVNVFPTASLSMTSCSTLVLFVPVMLSSSAIDAICFDRCLS
jgi:hypothetical protein